jgi:hypothetical protein
MEEAGSGISEDRAVAVVVAGSRQQQQQISMKTKMTTTTQQDAGRVHHKNERESYK